MSIFENTAFARAAARIESENAKKSVDSAKYPRPRRGQEIFVEPGAPETWDAYVGQTKAKGLLRMSVASAKHRSARLDHVIIATGMSGAGKTTLARLLAHEMGVGLTETQGSVSTEEAAGILGNMKDGDIWFIDEAHQLIQGGKRQAEWLLPFLQDGVIMTAAGAQEVPDVTVVAATTDAQLLPETILQRFTIKPVLVDYSNEESTTIAETAAQKIFKSAGLDAPSSETCSKIATAANNSPRVIKGLLTSLRDAEISGMADRDENGDSDLTLTFEFAGVTPDGLDDMAQGYLGTLMVMCKGLGAMANIAALMGETTIPAHTEKILLRRGLIEITPRGRKLTKEGSERTVELLQSKGLMS